MKLTHLHMQLGTKPNQHLVKAPSLIKLQVGRNPNIDGYKGCGDIGLYLLLGVCAPGLEGVPWRAAIALVLSPSQCVPLHGASRGLDSFCAR